MTNRYVPSITTMHIATLDHFRNTSCSSASLPCARNAVAIGIATMPIASSSWINGSKILLPIP